MCETIGEVKKFVLNFYDNFKERLDYHGRYVDCFRIRLIVFRDFLSCGKDAFLTTDFFELPKQRTEFEKCVNTLITFGGSYIAKDGLEALACAIKSEWNTEGHYRSHVIAVFSNSPANELGHGSSSPYYPKGMPKDFDELSSWWGVKEEKGIIDNEFKCLFLYTHCTPSWNKISCNWPFVLHFSEDNNMDRESLYSEMINTGVDL